MRWDDRAPAVGDTASRSREVTHADIARFTALSGDHNPLHHDPVAAAATPFGGIVVHGGVTTAILNALVAEDLAHLTAAPAVLAREHLHLVVSLDLRCH